MAAPNSLSALGQAALNYARHHWPVFPCEPRGKRPLCKHGLKDATTDGERIRAWWRKWPDANVGFPTGERVVLDIDGPAGEAALAELEAKRGKLPATLTARTGREGGKHLYFAANAAKVGNSAGKLGPHLDTRGLGGYVILPPSIHASGKRYEWLDVHLKPAPLPTWFAALLAEPARTQAEAKSADGKIAEGQRNAALASLAGMMRRGGASATAIAAALLAENKLRCDPPLAEAEVRGIARSIGLRYEAGKPESENPWADAEGLDVFLAAGEDGAVFLDAEKRMLVRGSITEIFSPRGLGKSLYALWLALQLARRGLRVLYIDRDNPRHVIRARLRSFGATGGVGNLKIISREKCPPLTNAGAWALFPYSDFDVVILDSFDSAAEGIGEQDSAKPSRAIAPLLDIARRENGPAVLVLGNCVRTGKRSRGSGVIEDRADVSYEIRDATGFQPSGSNTPWHEEIANRELGADGWAARASRRKHAEKLRLAFVNSKFRPGVEPEPFVLEINLTSEPWAIRDVTDEIDVAGAEARAKRAHDAAEKISKARDALAAEVLRRDFAGEPVMLKERDAIPFLTRVPHNLKRVDARAVTENPEGRWLLARIEGQKGHPIGLLPPGKKENGGGNTLFTEAAKRQAEKESDFSRPHEKGAAEIDPSQARMNGGPQEPLISAEDSPVTPRPAD
jgi:hypothetical protein